MLRSSTRPWDFTKFHFNPSENISELLRFGPYKVIASLTRTSNLVLLTCVDEGKVRPKVTHVTRKLNKILVVDIESTCWPDAPPRNQESEIIEIGLCVVDTATATRVEKESIFVRPEHSTVGPFCTSLTSLTQAQVETGNSFPEACAYITEKYQSRDRAWVSYGDYDRRQFEKQCRAHNIHYPFGRTHINIKTIFALQKGLQEEVGLDRAFEMLGLPFEGTHHRGVDDAWNIARLFIELLLKRP